MLIYLSSIPNFEMNIKAAHTGSIAAQTRDLIALMKLHEKLLISIKNRFRCWMRVHVTLKKRRIRCSIQESNDAKVPPLQIAADCMRVKLINGILWRFRPNWITCVCAVLANLLVRSATRARSAGCESSLIRVGDLKKEKKRKEERGRKAPHARMHAYTHSEVNHPESNRLRAPTVIYNKQLEVFTGVCDSRLWRPTRVRIDSVLSGELSRPEVSAVVIYAPYCSFWRA